MPVPVTSGSFRTNILDMSVGDYFAYKYVASSGAAGVFSDFGAPLTTAQENEIPIAGTSTPNGYAYAIKVAPGIFIADRQVQCSISWDVLNTANYIQGKYITEQPIPINIRSLSGGVAYLGSDGKSSLNDAGLGAWPINNDWDYYIVKSSLDDKVIPGDDNVWHWNLWSWVQDTSSNGLIGTLNGSPTTATSAHRSVRGFSGDGRGVKRINCVTSSTASVSGGFRPVFEYVENNKQTNLWY